MKKLSTLLHEQLSHNKVIHHLSIKEILSKWEEFFPGAIGKKTHPVDYINGTLFIYAESSEWSMEVQLTKESIIQTLNNLLNADTKIEKIRITSKKTGNLST